MNNNHIPNVTMCVWKIERMCRICSCRNGSSNTWQMNMVFLLTLAH